MNFDSIEGLSDEDINELYFEEEKLVEWYGTFCKTIYADDNSYCVSFFTRYAHIDHCALDCTNSITFSAEAMKAKCAELCGKGTDVALEANVHKHSYSHAHPVFYGCGYCHGFGYVCYADCHQSHYHSCHEAVWSYAMGHAGRYHYFHGRHEHPWPITWTRCQALKTR